MTTAAIITTAGRAAILGGVVLAAGSAGACSIDDVQGPFNRALAEGVHNLVENKRVQQGPDCSFVNGGKDDDILGQAAIDLGAGRIGQSFKTGRGDLLLVVVCPEREAVVLSGVTTPLAEPKYSGCGGEVTEYDELKAYLPGKGSFDYQAGKDFRGFLAYMNGFGMSYSEDLDRIYDRGQSRDRVNLLCGCEVFYPQTMN